MYEKQA
jgi:hypothetical protein